MNGFVQRRRLKFSLRYDQILSGMISGMKQIAFKFPTFGSVFRFGSSQTAQLISDSHVKESEDFKN